MVNSWYYVETVGGRNKMGLNKAVIISLVGVIIALSIGLGLALGFGHYGSNYVTVTTSPPEMYLDRSGSSTITNNSSSGVDLTLQNDPNVVNMVVNGEAFYIKMSELQHAIDTYTQPYFYGHNITIGYQPDSDNINTFSILVYNPLDTEVKLVFGVDSPHPELFTLPADSYLGAKEYRLFNFQEKLLNELDVSRLFFDYYQYGEFVSRVYFGERS